MDSFVRKLSDHIGKNWKKVARELKFPPTDVDAIEYKARDDLKEQIHLFFEAWKMREGSRATVKMLVDALKEANLQGILDELMTGINSPTSICMYIGVVDNSVQINIILNTTYMYMLPPPPTLFCMFWGGAW